MRWCRLVAAAAALVAALPGTAAAGTPVGSYDAPPFADECTVHRFGEGVAPDPLGYPDDPLCVEYAKRDITVSNGGAVRFLLAEPARFAIAVPACRYWQLDHWSVQVRPGGPTLVGWDGSYWFDKAAGTAGASVRNVTVAGQPAEPEEAAAALRPYDPRLADALEKAARGVSVQLPAGLPCVGLGT